MTKSHWLLKVTLSTVVVLALTVGIQSVFAVQAPKKPMKSCGAKWSAVFSGNVVSQNNPDGTFVVGQNISEEQMVRLVRDGCSFKVVEEVVLDGADIGPVLNSFECSNVNVGVGAMGMQTFFTCNSATYQVHGNAGELPVTSLATGVSFWRENGSIRYAGYGLNNNPFGNVTLKVFAKN